MTPPTNGPRSLTTPRRPATKTCKVALGTRGSGAITALRIKHFLLTEEDANVAQITSLVRREFDDERLQLVNRDGLAFEDNTGTRGKTIWLNYICTKLYNLIIITINRWV
jgi:hypothetical protein